jgi:hypothetical protein
LEFGGKRVVDPDLHPNYQDLKLFVEELLSESTTGDAATAAAK